MKFPIPLVLIVLLGSLLAPACGPGDPEKHIVVATDTTLIPMSFNSAGGDIIGFEPDLIHAIAERENLEVTMINVQWNGLFGGLITRKYDAAAASITILPERKERMAFSIPYLQSGLSLVVRRDNEDIHSIAEAREKDKLVGAQVGTTAYFYLEDHPDIRKKGYQAYGHAVTDLIKGEVDAVLGESTATLYYKNRRKEYFQNIKMVGDILTEEYYGIAVHKANKDLLRTFNRALCHLLDNDTVERLHKKWELGLSSRVPKVDPRCRKFLASAPDAS